MDSSDETSSTKPNNGWKIATLIIVAILIIGNALIQNSDDFNSRESNSQQNTQKNPTSDRTQIREVIFTGLGETSGTEKKSFGGNYKVNWLTESDCYYSARLSSGESIFSASAAMAGTTYIYDLQNGDYFLSMITGAAPSCPWGVQFLPID